MLRLHRRFRRSGNELALEQRGLQAAAKLIRGQAPVQPTANGQRDFSALLGHHDGDGIALFRQANRGTMTRAEVLAEGGRAVLIRRRGTFEDLGRDIP